MVNILGRWGCKIFVRGRRQTFLGVTWQTILGWGGKNFLGVWVAKFEEVEWQNFSGVGCQNVFVW